MTTRPTLDSTPEDASLAKWTTDVEGFVENLIGNPNLPSAPAEVKVVSQSNSVKVTFRAVNEVGVSEYKIYRSTDKNFSGGKAEHIATVTQAIDPSATDIIYIDAESTEKSYYFVSAVKGLRRPRLEGIPAGFGSATEGHEIGETSGGGSGGTISGFSGIPGSILFVNEDSLIDQDNENLFYSQSFKVPVAGPAGISWGPHNLPDVFLVRDDSDILALRRGTNAQSFRVYESFVTIPPDITSSLLLAEIDQVDRTVYTTSSISPSANKLILCAVQAADNGFVGPIIVNTITGAGLTWVKIAEVQYNTISGPRLTHAVFRALGSSPSPGSLTITLDGSSAEASWVISEHGGVDTGGTNGSDAVVQFATNVTDSDTSIAATLSAFANSANATYGSFAFAGGPAAWTPGSGFIEIGENVAPGTLITQAQFRADNSTTVDASHSGAADDLSVIAIEIKNASQAGNSFLDLNALGSTGESEVMVDDSSGADRDLVIGTRAGVAVSAITATAITGSLFDESDSTTYTFPSWTPVTGRVYIATVSCRRAPTTVLPTLAGNGITWTQVATTKQTFAAGENQITVFRGLASSPSTGTLVATFGNTQIRGSITVHELDNVDTGGPNGENAIVQSAVGVGLSVNSVTATLGAFANANNATMGFGTADNPSTQGAFSPGTGFGAFDPNLLTGSQFNSIAVEFRNDNDTTVDFTSAGSAGPMQIIGLELKRSTSTSGDLRLFSSGIEIVKISSEATFGRVLSSPIDIVVLASVDLVGDGQRDSHSLLWTAKGFETATPHDVDWKSFVETINDDGTQSKFVWQSRVDADSYVEIMSLSDKGGSEIPNQPPTSPGADVLRVGGGTTDFAEIHVVGGTTGWLKAFASSFIIGTSITADVILMTNGLARLNVLSANNNGDVLVQNKLRIVGAGGSDGVIQIGTFASEDLHIHRDAADTWAQRRGSNNQTFRVYETLIGTPPAITQTVLLADGDDIDRTVYTTASISPTANKLIICQVMAADQGFTATVHVDSVTGAGLTWVEMVDLNFDTIASGRRCLAVYRALGPAPSSGALTITLDSPGTACRWIITEFDNIDTSGTNGSGAIVQNATNRADSGTSITATLAAFASTSNATLGCFGSGSVSTTLTEGSGFTKIAEVDLGTIKFMMTFRDDNDTTVDMSQSVDGDMAVIAFEIKNAVSAGDSRYVEIIGLGASGASEVMAVTGGGATDRDLVLGAVGTEIMRLGASGAAFTQVLHSGAFVSDGGSNIVTGTMFDTDITGFSGDGSLAQVRMRGSITTSGAGDALGVATLILEEPDITLTGPDTMAIASTLLITGAPTEGTSANYALYIDDGAVRIDGETGFKNNVNLDNVGNTLTLGSGVPQGSGNLVIIGNWVPGSGNTLQRFHVAGEFRAVAGNTLIQAGGRFDTTFMTQASQTVADLAQLVLEEPNITLGGGGAVTRASTFLIQDAPTEGVQNFAMLVKSGESSFGGDLSIHNVTEGRTARMAYKTAHETHTLAAAKTSDTTTISIPAGAKLLGASFNVNTAVTDDDGDNTWSAAFITGASESLASGAAAAQNTKVNSLTANDEVTTATTEIQFTANGSNFTAGVIEIVVYYMELTSLADV